MERRIPARKVRRAVEIAHERDPELAMPTKALGRVRPLAERPHGAQHPVRDIGGSGDLQEVAATILIVHYS